MTSASVVMVCLANAGAALRTNVVERSYDRFGRLVALSVNGERRTELAYDEAMGRIASMRVADEADPFQWEYEYGSDLKKSLRYPNGALVTWEYEPRRDLVTLVSNDVYSTFRYEYDAAGRRVSKNDERYEYNERGELTLATNVVTSAAFAYRYDDIGNRVWSRELGTNCTYVANELNQYTNIVRGGVSERSAFDLDGNQTNVVTATGEWAVEYNGENRPVRWTRKSDGATVVMAYDRMGRRVRKNEEVSVYDGYLNVGRAVWDPTEPVATRPLAWLGKDGNSFCLHDGNKNVVTFVPTASSLEVRNCSYAPFGAIADNRDGCSPWRFSSEIEDFELALAYYNYRHYSPSLGRWLRRDLLDQSVGADVYGFCRNRPSNNFDSLGQWVIYGKEYSDRSVVVWTKTIRRNTDRHVLVGYDLKIVGGVLIPLPNGYAGYLRQTCECHCRTYSSISSKTGVCRHFVRKVDIGGHDPCKGSYSGSYVEDRGWRGSVETTTDYQTLGTYAIYTKPPSNIQVAYECRMPCLIACQGQSVDRDTEDPSVDCSNL